MNDSSQTPSSAPSGQVRDRKPQEIHVWEAEGGAPFRPSERPSVPPKPRAIQVFEDEGGRALPPGTVASPIDL